MSKRNDAKVQEAADTLRQMTPAELVDVAIMNMATGDQDYGMLATTGRRVEYYGYARTLLMLAEVKLGLENVAEGTPDQVHRWEP